MDEYLCVTLASAPAEAEAAFKSRITAFWSRMLREYPDQFERVYAETVAFEPDAGQLTRKYLVEAGIVDWLAGQLHAAGLAHRPIDADDLYTKYEAAPPEWFWIEH
jgi:hypothetical protein